ncbi:hypothetical protein [Weizmannia acidilactici]|uniref:hypothetical protein n=1 Tax=Weizmannia acidilactici TaxID=2607726 RepID=UPI0012787AB3|nr:hypothetical protein [Weizmannia acidilactici]GER72745.1 hypothetical protein BpPP18_08120 [Weizmannia acidilactici]
MPIEYIIWDVLYMDDTKKNIIINEIKMWKENHMIPQEYCDFLLALYNGGTEGGTGEKQNAGGRKKPALKLAVFSVFILALAGIAVFVIYFTELHFILQTVILTAFVGFLLIVGIRYANKEFFFSLFFIGAAFILLMLSVLVNEKLFGNQRHSLYLLLFANCALWLVVGKSYKLLFFTVSGILGTAILVFSILI